jgi:hypothetical protein
VIHDDRPPRGGPVPLDEGTAERLLRGLDPADAPPGYASVSKVLRALVAPPDAVERAGEAEAVARFVALRRPAGGRRGPAPVWRPNTVGGTRPSNRGPTRGGTKPRRTRNGGGGNRRALVGGTVVVAVAIAIAAGTGALPNGPQGVVHKALGAIGVSVPAAANDQSTSHDVATSAGAGGDGTRSSGTRSAGGSIVGGGTNGSHSGGGGTTRTTGSSKQTGTTGGTSGSPSSTQPGGDGSPPIGSGGTVGGGGGGGTTSVTYIFMGPQAMLGDLRVAPGTTLAVGYDLAMPGRHPAATVSVLGAQVVFTATCVSGAGGGTISVPIGDASYAIGASSTAWYPGQAANDPATFEGSGTVPDLCNGSLVRLQQGGTFEAGIGSTDTTDHVQVRWHYATNGQGPWSGTQSVVPGS